MQLAQTIAIVDDHEMVRNGLAIMLNGLNGYTVTILAAHGKELIAAMGEHGSPAIAIVDLSMPVMDGFETIAWLRKHAPNVHPVALSFNTDTETTARVAQTGACGFLLKNIRPAELQHALDSVMRTGFCNNDLMVQGVALNGIQRSPFEKERDLIMAQITPREMEFLRLVCSAEEHTYTEIAAAMNISPRSVENFRNHLFEKFDIKSKAGLVQFAMRYGLLTDENG